MATAIERTLRMAHQVEAPDVKTPAKTIKAKQDEVKHYEHLLSKLLPVERAAAEAIEKKNREALQSVYSTKGKLVMLQRKAELARRYHCLSLEPLTWRDEQGFPRLAVFRLDRDDPFQISISGDTTYGNVAYFQPDLPEAIRDCFKDVERLLRDRSRRKRTNSRLSCRFSGLIPDFVKEKIKAAKDSFEKCNIFIIAEPKAWELDESVPLPVGDPLIVGYDAEADPKALWLIADFDTTPVEEAMILGLPGK
jgi:hypothetical protein